MASEAWSDCEIWDLKPFPRPPHSRLHCLEPVGLGTAAVESLTGYISRLAETHGVTPRILMAHELVPLLGRERLTRPVNGGLSSFLSKDTRSLNGTGRLAQDMVAVLQTLTLRQDLRFLTLLTWEPVLPSRGLLRRNRVWCPVCYHSWWQTGQIIYEPLLWSLEVVTICPIHHCYLMSTCPYPDCQMPQPILGPHTQPGHCSHCLRWLGLPLQDLPSKSKAVPENEDAWQTWVTQETGALLATAADIPSEPTLQNIYNSVNRWIDRITQGNADAFARLLQVSPSSISCWRSQRQRIQLGILLRLCHLLGTSLRHIFTQGSNAVVESNFNKNGWTLEAARPKCSRRVFEHERVRTVLLEVLNGKADPSPPMRQVCKQLGYDPTFIYYHFPDLCRAISARYMAYQKEQGKQRLQQLCAEVRQNVLIVHHQGKYPSAYRVQALLSVPGFMRHTEAKAVWHATLRELGWES